MLVEMFSPVFMERGEVRPPIRFKEGLNVVLGKEDGANSIGKSSAMLAIDFVFGGNTYLKSDGVRHIGHHTIFFAFLFDGETHYFARSTEDADKVFPCKANYDLIGPYWTKDEFVDWLRCLTEIRIFRFTARTLQKKRKNWMCLKRLGNTTLYPTLSAVKKNTRKTSLLSAIWRFNSVP